jgi:hypothetical protein
MGDAGVECSDVLIVSLYGDTALVTQSNNWYVRVVHLKMAALESRLTGRYIILRVVSKT